MKNSSDGKKDLQEQELFLQSRGFHKAPEGASPLPGQYSIQKSEDNDETSSLTLIVNTGHYLRKLTGFTDNT